MSVYKQQSVKVPASAAAWVHPLTSEALVQRTTPGVYEVTLDGAPLGTIERVHTSVSTAKGGSVYWSPSYRGKVLPRAERSYEAVSILLREALDRAARA